MNIISHIRQQLLSQYASEEADAMARIIAEDAFGFSLVDCLTEKAVLSPFQQQQLDSMLQALLSGIPLQYVLGKALFMGNYFKVTPSVLIPRPETEDLVDMIINHVGNQTVKICDAGTGSGCIAVSLCKMLGNAFVTALDISPEALAVAQHNASMLHADVQFLHADILQPSTLPAGPWDVIVSNPPYVMNKEKATMENHVKDYEPSLALFVDDNDPLLFYRSLGIWAKNTLASQGTLYCEINTLLASQTATMFQEQGFSQVNIHSDRYNKPRFVQCRK